MQMIVGIVTQYGNCTITCLLAQYLQTFNLFTKNYKK